MAYIFIYVQATTTTEDHNEHLLSELYKYSI